MYSAIFSAVSVPAISSVFITLEDTVVNVTIDPLLPGVAATVLCCIIGGNVTDAAIVLQRSSVALLCNGSIPVSIVALIGMIGLTDNSSNIGASFTGSSAAVDVVSNVSLQIDVAVMCVIASGSLSNFAFAALGVSSLATSAAVHGGVTNASGVFIGSGVDCNILALIVSASLRGVSTILQPNTSVNIVAVCSGSCEPGRSGSFFAHVLFFSSVVNIENITFIAIGTSLVVKSPNFAMMIRFYAELSLLSDATVRLANCNASLTIRGQSIGTSERIASMLHVSPSLMRNMNASFDNVRVVGVAESGRNTQVQQVFVTIFAGVLNTSIDIRNSVLSAVATNGTVPIISPLPGVSLALLTLVAAFINFGPFSPHVATSGTAFDIVMTNASLTAEHSTDLPPGAAFLFVGSLVSAVVMASPMTDSTICMYNVHVQRSFPASAGPASWFPAAFDGFRQNATALAFDGKMGAPAAFRSLVGFLTLVVHTNVTITLTSSTVGYHRRLVPASPDIVSIVVLPSVLNMSSVSVESTMLFPESDNVRFGSHGVSVHNSTAAMMRIPRNALTLLYVDDSNLTLVAPARLVFDSVAHFATETPLTLNPLMIGNGTIIFTVGQRILQGSTPPTLIVLRSQVFQGYAQLLDPRPLRISDTTRGLVLSLGCNLWDGSPLLPRSIGFDAALRPHIAYPHSAFNTTVACAGFQAASATASLTTPSFKHTIAALPSSTASPKQSTTPVKASQSMLEDTPPA